MALAHKDRARISGLAKHMLVKPKDRQTLKTLLALVQSEHSQRTEQRTEKNAVDRTPRPSNVCDGPAFMPPPKLRLPRNPLGNIDAPQVADEPSAKTYSCTVPAPISVILPDNAEALLATLAPWTDNFRNLVKEWAQATLGTTDPQMVSIAMRDRMSLPIVPEEIRTALHQAIVLDGEKANTGRRAGKEDESGYVQQVAKCLALSDDELVKSRSTRKLLREAVARRVFLDIKAFAQKQNTSRSHGDRIHTKALCVHLEPRLRTFAALLDEGVWSANPDAKSNKRKQIPSFPYISTAATDWHAEYILALQYLADQHAEIAEEALADTAKALHKALGKMTRHPQTKYAQKVWQRGAVLETQKGAILWDVVQKQLVVVMVTSSGEPLDLNRYRYLDGRRLDKQLTTPRGHGKSVIVAPLATRHDFKRWWLKHISNHDPRASVIRRCNCTSFQFLLSHDRTQLLVRPTLTIGTTLTAPSDPQYVVGVDRGIYNPIAFAILNAYDLVGGGMVEGRVQEYRHESALLKAAQAAASTARNALNTQRTQGNKRRLIKAQRAVMTQRARMRRFKGTQIVEAVSQLCDQLETQLGHGNYIVAVEKLSNMSVGNLNNTKHLATVLRALQNKMIRLGYDPSRVISEVWAAHTSQIGLSGWKIGDSHHSTGELPYGRNITGAFSPPLANGTRKRVRYGRGIDLFHDPITGVIYDADFLAAINIALRHGIEKTKVRGQCNVVDMSREAAKTVKLLCPIKTYHPISVDGTVTELQPRGAYKNTLA